MNILLVDDDEYIIRAIREKIIWENFGISNIYVAYNIRQAKELLIELPIQLMICDIEMPQGSGLDLLEWVRSKKYDIQTIFLTSYADFQYAQKALELKSLNYYLKPVDYLKLEQGIKEAVEKAEESLHQTNYKKESEYWKKNQKNVIRNFFYTIITQEWIESELIGMVQNAGLSYNLDSKFLPIWIELYDDKGSLEKWERIRIILGIENLARESCRGINFDDIRVISIEHMSFVVLLELSDEENSFLALRNAFERLAEKCRGKFKTNVFLGIGSECVLSDFKGAVTDLKRICADNVMEENEVISVIEYENTEIPYHLPTIKTWEVLLQENNENEFIEKVENYLEELKNKKQLNQEILRLFRMDMMQLMYARLKQTQVQTYRLFVNETGDTLYQKAIESVEDMMIYVRYLTQVTISYSNLAEKPQSVVEKMKDYIDKNYIKDITRNDLVEIVYLNSDYISRLFKKEVGISISAYLLNKRISVAKELLENTNMPINVISMHVGYSNFSYFTRMFRDNMGCPPNEYRKKIKKMENKQ